MKKFLSFLMCFVFVFFACSCKPNSDLDELSSGLTNYEISIDFNLESKQATVKQKVDYINSTDTILRQVKFHLYPQFFEEGATNMVVPSQKMNLAYPNGMSYANFEINRLSVAGKETQIVYENEFDSILVVNLENSLLPDDRVDICMEYVVALPNCAHRFGYSDNTINLNNFYPIACVYENGDFNTSGYNPNGDPFYSDIANYSVDISCDKQLVVANTGSKISCVDEVNIKTTHMTAKCVRDFALVLSKDFEILSQKVGYTTIEYYCYNDEYADKSLQAGVDAINTFNKLFGSYPYENYSIVKCDFVYGGMEFPNLVMISDNIDNLDDYMNVIIHETAHQWWYGLIGNNQYQNPWLDEAITEFSTILFYDNNDGYNLNHADMVNISHDNYSLFMSVYQDVLGSIDTSMRAVDEYDTEPEYTYCTYVKGVLMYESLYQLIGEKKFIAGLKDYFNSNKFQNVTPDKLINSFEKTSKSDLSAFFDSWINGKVVIR